MKSPTEQLASEMRISVQARETMTLVNCTVKGWVLADKFHSSISLKNPPKHRHYPGKSQLNCLKPFSLLLVKDVNASEQINSLRTPKGEL